MNNTDKLVVIKGLNKVYLTDTVETHALSNLDLVVYEGEYISISGPSGCGKSTLLSILGLLDKPTSGRFELNGVDVSSLNASQRARIRNQEIGFVFQDFNLIGDLTVYENVELPLTYRNISKEERRSKVLEHIEMVGISQRVDHYPKQLSGGQQQRVAVARALVGNPSMLLADEPTGNLDSKNGDAVMKLLSDLNSKGVTVCMVTHDSRYANNAKRVVNLLDGKIDISSSKISSLVDAVN